MAKATHTTNQTKHRIFLYKTIARYCFIFLISFVFALLKFSSFLYANPSGKGVKKHFVSYASGTTEYSYTEGVPTGPVSGEPDMEEMEEDEETKTKTEHGVETVYLAYTADEQFFSSFLKSRYLHKESALHNRQDIPFFVLYHSWKSYLG